MTHKDKELVIAALEEYKGDSTGLIAATIEDCQRVVGEMPTEDGWIPVTERLPQEFISVLVCIPSEHPLPMVKEAYLANGLWATKSAIFNQQDITHWMPMPEPPREDA